MIPRCVARERVWFFQRATALYRVPPPFPDRAAVEREDATRPSMLVVAHPLEAVGAHLALFSEAIYFGVRRVRVHEM